MHDYSDEIPEDLTEETRFCQRCDEYSYEDSDDGTELICALCGDDYKRSQANIPKVKTTK